MDFLYCGEANVYQENLDSFLAIAEELQLKGLMGKTNDYEIEEKETTKKRTVPVYKSESSISSFSESTQSHFVNQIAVTEYGSTAGTMALKSHFSGDLQDLDNKTNSMMAKTGNKNFRGQLVYKCTICGKQGERTQLKNHIEANHLEGISVPCNLCEKTFRSRNSLSNHKTVYHKRNVFQD